MKKITIYTLLAILFSFASNGAVLRNYNEVAGKWKYELPDAPEGYQNGIIDISVKNDTLIGQVLFSEENKTPIRDIVYRDNTLTCNVYVEYEYIKVKMVIKGNKMEGAVDTSDGIMKFTAAKIVK